MPRGFCSILFSFHCLQQGSGKEDQKVPCPWGCRSARGTGLLAFPVAACLAGWQCPRRVRVGDLASAPARGFLHTRLSAGVGLTARYPETRFSTESDRASFRSCHHATALFSGDPAQGGGGEYSLHGPLHSAPSCWGCPTGMCWVMWARLLGARLKPPTHST